MRLSKEGIWNEAFKAEQFITRREMFFSFIFQPKSGLKYILHL